MPEKVSFNNLDVTHGYFDLNGGGIQGVGIIDGEEKAHLTMRILSGSITLRNSTNALIENVRGRNEGLLGSVEREDSLKIGGPVFRYALSILLVIFVQPGVAVADSYWSAHGDKANLVLPIPCITVTKSSLPIQLDGQSVSEISWYLNGDEIFHGGERCSTLLIRGVDRHTKIDESFFILDGVFEVTVDGQTETAAAGAFVQIPGGTVHSFKNVSKGLARTLTISSPHGLEAYFRAAGEEISNPYEQVPPKTQEGIAKLIALGPKYGVEILAPPVVQSPKP